MEVGVFSSNSEGLSRMRNFSHCFYLFSVLGLILKFYLRKRLFVLKHILELKNFACTEKWDLAILHELSQVTQLVSDWDAVKNPHLLALQPVLKKARSTKRFQHFKMKHSQGIARGGGRNRSVILRNTVCQIIWRQGKHSRYSPCIPCPYTTQGTSHI